MVKYITRRLIYMVFVFFVLSIFMFFIYKLVPGDPVRMMLDTSIQTSDPAKYQLAYEALRKRMNLDKPLPLQYVGWISGMLTGDFGFSSQYRMQVIDIIKTPMRNSILLNFFSILLIFLITIPLGIISATKKYTAFDNIVQVGTVVGFSIPNFIVALLLIFALAVKIPIFPISGMNSPGFQGTGMARTLDTLHHMGLPVLAIVVSGLGSITRYVRGAMIDCLRMDYIRTARSKGLREKVVIYSHAFRNALIPVVTIVTGSIVGLFGGSVAIESIFSWNGIGNVLFIALKQLDYSVVLTMQMFYVVLSLVSYLIMDIGYCMVDPRVKLS